jgi:hypothetical protein
MFARLSGRHAFSILAALALGVTLPACSGAGAQTVPAPWRPQALSALDRHTPCRAAFGCRGASQFVYVSNLLQPSGSPGAIDYYPVGSNGDVAPSGVITGPKTGVTSPVGLVVDGAGEIYVANDQTNTIVGFPAGSNGNESPNIVISGSITGLASPNGLALDDAGNLFVTNCGNGCNYGPPGPTTIEEFAPGSNGNVAPIRTISGPRTQLQVHVNGIFVDDRGYIYVACAGPNVVNVYAPHARGDAAPVRVLGGSMTGIASPDGVVVGRDGLYVTSTNAGVIGRFARAAGGNVPPIATLDVNWSNTGQQIMDDIIIAPDDTLYVVGFSVPVVAQYSLKARGRATPITEIVGSNTQLVIPTAVFVR